MISKGLPVILLLTIALWSCYSSAPDEYTAQVSAIQGLNFANPVQNRSTYGGCDSVAGTGVQADITFLEPSVQFSGKASQELSRQIRQQVIRLMNAYTDSSTLRANPLAESQVKAAFNAFSDSYLAFRQKFPEAAGCWFIEFTGDTLLATPRLVVYRLDQYTSTGGAHPNSYTTYLLLNAETGQPEKLSTFVSDEARLLKEAERAFRELEQLPAETRLEEQGYFLPNDTFFLPPNVAFTREGVLLLYNPYEIAAYARGPIELLIPYARLKGTVQIDRIF
jgi:hypothetical protein